MIRAFFLFLVFFIIGTQVHAQLIPPSKPDGFVYPPGRRVDPDTILIEAFYDPVCPYSRDSWPPLKQAPKHYGSRVSLLLHLLPLPYHDNAYVTSRALHIANTHNANATFSLLEGFFKHQAMFYGAQTQLLTRPEVVGRIVKLGTATLGNSYRHVLKSGFNDTKSERATRVSFKHSTSRGVYGTPTFYVNGFKLPDADTPSELGGWKKIIDSLIHPQKKKKGERGSSSVQTARLSTKGNFRKTDRSHPANREITQQWDIHDDDFYEQMRGVEICPSRFAHRDTTDALGITEDIEALLEKIGLGYIFDLHCDCYADLTRQFLASARLYHPDEDNPVANKAMFSFIVNRQFHSMAIFQLCDVFGFEKGRQSCVPDFPEHNDFWKFINSGNFISREAKQARIRSPIYL